MAIDNGAVAHPISLRCRGIGLRYVPPRSSSPSDQALIGTLAALVCMLIWAGWIVGTRHAVTHDLDPFAVGFLRFAVPAVIFAPIWLRTGLKPTHIAWPVLASLMGAGAPFFVTVAVALRYAPAAEVGPLLPGAMALIVAVLSMAFFAERLSGARTIGLVLIAAGLIAIGGWGLVSGSGSCLGRALLLAAAGMWAVYTLQFKRSGLSAVDAAAIVGAWSCLAMAPLGVPAMISAVQAGLAKDLAMQALVQGVLSGVVGILLYGAAVGRLGASRAAAFSALVPALAAVIAVPVLGEYPDMATIFGIAATTVGVVLVAGVLGDTMGAVAGKSKA